MPAKVSAGLCLILFVLCLGGASSKAAEAVRNIPLVNRNDVHADVELSEEGGRRKAVPFLEISPDSPLLRKLRDAAARRHHYGPTEKKGSPPASGSGETRGGIAPAGEESPQDGR